MPIDFSLITYAIVNIVLSLALMVSASLNIGLNGEVRRLKAEIDRLKAEIAELPYRDEKGVMRKRGA